MPNNDHIGITKEQLAALNLKEVPFQLSTMETIDFAIYDFLDKNMDIHLTTNGGFKKVPIIWTSTERAYQVKHDKTLRDQGGTLVLPAVSLHRTGITKDVNIRGGIQPHHIPNVGHKGQTITVARRINQDKTADFENAYSNRLSNNRVRSSRFLTKKVDRKIVYETVSMPIPVWVQVGYTITLRSEYQQQMNEMLQPFVTKFGNIDHFMISRDGHKYESFVDGSFSEQNNLAAMQTEERRFETSVNVRVLGYLMGEGENSDQPKVVVRENFVEYRMPRERVVMGDVPIHGGDGTSADDANRGVDGGYRE